jgi:hypothetical protein
MVVKSSVKNQKRPARQKETGTATFTYIQIVFTHTSYLPIQTKNGSDRSQIQSREFEIEGKRWRPTEDVAKRAIALSDTLNINEKEAFILFVKAQEVCLFVAFAGWTTTHCFRRLRSFLFVCLL